MQKYKCNKSFNISANLCSSHCRKNNLFQRSADLFSFTKKTPNGKLHYLCNVILHHFGNNVVNQYYRCYLWQCYLYNNTIQYHLLFNHKTQYIDKNKLNKKIRKYCDKKTRYSIWVNQFACKIRKKINIGVLLDIQRGRDDDIRELRLKRKPQQHTR